MNTRSLAIVVLLRFITAAKGSNPSCPSDFNYVHQIPWDCSFCQSGNHLEQCCISLWSLFDMGVAQHFQDSSLFGFPDNASATACINEFQHQISSMGSMAALSPTLASVCLNTTEMVSNRFLCNGIQTKKDWIDLLGSTTAIDSSCKGDLSDSTVCSSCLIGVRQVIGRLAEMNKNITEHGTIRCLQLAAVYAAVVNEMGPKSPITASCIFRLGMSATKTKDGGRLVLICTSAGAAVIVASLSGFLIVWLLRRRRSRDADHRQFVNRNINLLRATMRPDSGAVWFSVQEIKTATHNFNPANLIGHGSFGTVYRGTLPCGQLVAVKRIRNCSVEGDVYFLNEVEIINNIRHRNLVGLRGCCIASDDKEGHQRFLIHDYMSNGNLDEHLYRNGSLNWAQRKNIVLGIGKGLAYLHRGVQPAIYHRDIKPTNILLDDDMNARVCDFGVARMMTKEEEGKSHLTTRVAGTYGYLAPEYALYGQLTDKSDVYSFGAVLLEIMSGRRALDNSLESASDYLVADWAWKLVKEGKVMEVIDERILHSGPKNIMMRFVSVGILCAHVMVAYRPTIVEAMAMLQGNIEIPEIPDRPLPISHLSLISGNSVP